MDDNVIAIIDNSDELRRWSMLFPYLITPGVADLADTKRCYWLLDIVGSYQHEPVFQLNQGFQRWTLMMTGPDSCRVVADNGNDANNKARPYEEFCRQEVEFTDFPSQTCVLWFINGVILLPSEY